jgi:hypothetical protein
MLIAIPRNPHKAMVAGQRLGWKKLTLTQTASIDKVKTGRVSAMKQPTTQLNVPPQPQGLSNSSIDTATLELLAAWKSEDARRTRKNSAKPTRK